MPQYKNTKAVSTKEMKEFQYSGDREILGNRQPMVGFKDNLTIPVNEFQRQNVTQKDNKSNRHCLYDYSAPNQW